MIPATSGWQWQSSEFTSHSLKKSSLSLTVVYRIRILESNPAGYLDYFGFGLDWISFPFQPDPFRNIQMK